MEHDNERLLLDLACQKLRQHQLLRPAIGMLERLVGSLTEQAYCESFRRLRPLFDQPGLRATLDVLLVPDDTPAALTRHRWLCQAATTASPDALTQALNKSAFLQHLGVPAWYTDTLHINRQKRLTKLVRARRFWVSAAPKPGKYTITLWDYTPSVKQNGARAFIMDCQ